MDADFKDTEAFYNQIEGTTADREWPQLQAILPGLIKRPDAELANKAALGGEMPVNRLRQRVLAHVRSKAAEAPGLFTLTVPTGGGKTLTSLAFALDHARAHGMRRIIYAIPFTSVIDQTAEIFQKLSGDDVVLEHHSAIDEEKVKTRSSWEKVRLAMEDWAAPIVVTTTVQLFESLFSARPSRGDGAREELHGRGDDDGSRPLFHGEAHLFTARPRFHLLFIDCGMVLKHHIVAEELLDFLAF